MLGIFRGFMNSRVGLIITFVVLGVIALAFGLSDVTGLRSNALGGGPAGSDVATVGKESLSAAEVKGDTQRTVEMYRQQYPQLTMEEFVAKGGFDQPLDNRLNGMALEQFGQSQGMRIGKALADSEIAAQFKGIDGKFDRDLYKQTLAQRRLTDQQVHAEIARNFMARLLIAPFTPESLGRPAAPTGLALPYASMLLEKRTGTVAFIDTKKMPAGAPVTDAEATAYYKANIARYTVPERRSVRYATISIADLRAKSAPSDAEIAQAYQQQAAKFAPSEARTLRQVVLLDQKAAEALAAKVRAGTAIDAAAKAVGLDAATLADQSKAGYAGQANQALADQAFAAAEGATVGPVKTSLGWTVVHVDKITKVPGKSLDQARPDLVKELTEQKLALAATALRQQIGDAITNNATIDEIAKKLGLTLQSSPALDTQGNDPDVKPAPAQPDPVRAALAAVAFQAEPDDNPDLAPISKDGDFAVVKLDKIVPAAPRPLASVIDEVKKNFLIDRQVRQARDIASAVRDKVNKGVPLAKALAETGIAFDATKPVSGERRQLVGNGRPDRSLILLFATPQGAAKMLEAPFKGGWFVITTDSIQRGDARQKPDEVARMRSYLSSQAGDEYAQQFVRAVREKVGVKRNDAAIDALRRELLGQSGTPDAQ